ncbi:Clptm1 protein [Salpingoeca rosetta]|uniref:Clptm1 protein n=1 Tax=Salpingoeca rosetta (strain ATCC 50818 / BSB-021) TaxID=946362 RepID=F2TZQ1_SALR5|nr:Clptm1 protein [Salpingoeca rosetta]EGD79075.1 Clptm1 protein [Salpingoeca rosetta]|eukprot:XP_004998031.1 Clptm1 protein [Salpingoeca rosetta]
MNVPRQQEQEGEEAAAPGLGERLYKAMYYAMLFMVVQSLLSTAVSKLVQPSPDAASASASRRGGDGGHGSSRTADDARGVRRYQNTFHYSDPLSLYVYVTEDGPAFSAWDSTDHLVWEETGIAYGDWDAQLMHKLVEVDVSPGLKANGTLYVHAYVCKEGAPLDPSDPAYDRGSVAELHTNIIRYKEKKVVERKRHLLDAVDPTNDQSSDDSEEEGQHAEHAQARDRQIVAHWHGNLTLQLLTDDQPLMTEQLPPAAVRLFTLLQESREYTPPLVHNDFWDLRENMQEINATTASPLPLNITFGPIGMMKLGLYQSMQESLQHQRTLGTAAEAEQEMMKKMLLETNPYYLGLTMTVSLLHTVFDWMAFKNDIQFWRNRKSMEGLSLRALITSLVFQVIILLYLFDHTDTSWLILASSAVGVLIQGWKITRAADVSVSKTSRVLGIFPRVSIKGKADYKSTTEAYDQLAFKYLSWVMAPLFVGYAVYSLVYNEHKGWYSYAINMLAGAVYTFGFIQMTPQLFINYKLKSVSHMPWRVMTYKFLNTIVDDLFAFVISMPTMHRLACFRDDIVFLVFLYQRWIYRVDPNRRGEYDIPDRDGDHDEQQKQKQKQVDGATTEDADTGNTSTNRGDTEEKHEATAAPASSKASEKDGGTSSTDSNEKEDTGASRGVRRRRQPARKATE